MNNDAERAGIQNDDPQLIAELSQDVLESAREIAQGIERRVREIAAVYELELASGANFPNRNEGAGND